MHIRVPLCVRACQSVCKFLCDMFANMQMHLCTFLRCLRLGRFNLQNGLTTCTGIEVGSWTSLPSCNHLVCQWKCGHLAALRPIRAYFKIKVIEKMHVSCVFIWALYSTKILLCYAEHGWFLVERRLKSRVHYYQWCPTNLQEILFMLCLYLANNLQTCWNKIASGNELLTISTKLHKSLFICCLFTAN